LCDKAKSLLDHVKVIRELSYNYEVESRLEIVSLGEVSVPAFIMEFFNKDTDVELVRCRSIYTNQQSTIATAWALVLAVNIPFSPQLWLHNLTVRREKLLRTPPCQA
jgi:hypothetical protein